MREVKLSSKHQIVVPREARDALRLKAGSRVRVVVRNDMVILLPTPKSYAEALAGLGKGLYRDSYLAAERQSWR